ncbi:hypothetical protein C4K19_3743 [Pseudomonas chlororaphis subsp. aurantiaca]|nr:hypothetical protein C4K19_3743 [Pseudomonas chlororaphis subsp. aurantiaca]
MTEHEFWLCLRIKALDRTESPRQENPVFNPNGTGDNINLEN